MNLFLNKLKYSQKKPVINLTLLKKLNLKVRTSKIIFMKITKFIIALGLAAGITYSCNRDETNMMETESTQELVQTESVADFATDDNSDVAMDFATTFESNFTSKNSGGVHHPDYPCAVVTITSTNGTFPKTITVDFGTGCTDKRGITRKGKIIITATNKLYVPGAVITVTHDNFYVNGTKVEGELKLSNITTDLAVPTFSKEITNGKITKEDGTYFTFNSLRKRKMTAGVSTPKNVWDDVWEFFEGTQTVAKSNGNYLTSTIKTPLIKSNACHFISKGSIELKGTKVDGVLDFGNGDCDNKATFTSANGVVYQLLLRK